MRSLSTTTTKPYPRLEWLARALDPPRGELPSQPRSAPKVCRRQSDFLHNLLSRHPPVTFHDASLCYPSGREFASIIQRPQIAVKAVCHGSRPATKGAPVSFHLCPSCRLIGFSHDRILQNSTRLVSFRMAFESLPNPSQGHSPELGPTLMLGRGMRMKACAASATS